MSVLLLCLFDLLGLVLGIALLHGPVRRVRELLLGSALLGALVAASYGLGKLTWSDFVILRLLCHALFCVFVPLLIWRGWRWGGLAGWAFVGLGLSAEGCYLWARRVEPYRLEVTHHRIESERLAGRESPLRVAVLADLQTDEIGPFEQRVFAALAAERPDLLLVAGDLLQLGGGLTADEVRGEREHLAELFRGLEPPPRLGMWLVQGDCDARGDTFPGTGLRRLEDQAVEFPEEHVQLIGLSLGAARRSMSDELAHRARFFEGLTLVFAHAPEFALPAAELGFPLVSMAGHTHGGQVQFPLLGAPLTLARIPREMGAGGLFRLSESWLCVSRGLGMERHYAPRVRFLCRPELVLLELAPPRAGTEE